MRLPITLILILFYVASRAQDSSYVLKRSGNLDIYMDNNPDHIRKLSVWAGFNVGIDRWSFGGISWYAPKKHFAHLHFGTGAGYEGIVLLKNWLSTKVGSNSIHLNPQESVSTNFQYSKRNSFGVHYGAGWFSLVDFNDLKAANTFLGLSILRASGGQWKIPALKQTKRGSNFITYNLDFIHYFNHDYPASSNDSDKIRFGGRIYLEGNSSAWSKNGIFGLHYSFGFGTAPDWDYMLFMLGLGISFSFM